MIFTLRVTDQSLQGDGPPEPNNLPPPTKTFCQGPTTSYITTPRIRLLAWETLGGEPKTISQHSDNYSHAQFLMACLILKESPDIHEKRFCSIKLPFLVLKLYSPVPSILGIIKTTTNQITATQTWPFTTVRTRTSLVLKFPDFAQVLRQLPHPRGTTRGSLSEECYTRTNP